MGKADSVYDATSQAIQNNNLLVGAIMVIVLSGLSLWVLLTVTRPLAKAINIANQLAEGDLSADIEVKGKDETSQLLAAMKDMLENLKSFVADMSFMAASN